MRIRLQFFGQVRETVSLEGADLDVPAGSTVADAVRLAHRSIPGLSGPKVRYAVNTDYALESSTLSEGDTLSFIPPVGGG